MEIKITDMPTWVQGQIAAWYGQGKPSCHVEYVDNVGITSPWHDSCRQRVVLYSNGRTQTHQSCYYDSIMNASKDELATYMGTDRPYTLPEDGAVLVMLSYPKRVTLYMHISKAPRALEAPVPELSKFDHAVLYNLHGLTSAGRKDCYSRYRVPMSRVNASIDKLVGLGLATRNKAGAVASTMAGRNLVEKYRDAEGYQWANSYWYREEWK